MPKQGKTFRLEHLVESEPTDGLEGLAKVKLGDDCRRLPLMASLNDVGSVDKVFRDASPFDEPGLVVMN